MSRLAALTLPILVTAWALLNPAGSVNAIEETGYTLPFYATSSITCDYGMRYREDCLVDLDGTHKGIDYSVGINTTDGEVVAAAAGGRRRAAPTTAKRGGLF
jgi:hypothetical protein